MSRRRFHKRHAQGEHYAMIPLEVLQSEAFTTLPNYAVRVLVAIAAQYRGKNNGDLAMTRAIARTFGVTAQEHLIKSIAMFLDRGLIQKTRQGGKKPMGPTLYAVTWKPIDDLGGKIESGATTSASNAWVKWRSAVDQSKTDHRVCPQTALGLPADQTGPVSGLRTDQRTRFIGSASRPPSRSWPEAPINAEANGTQYPRKPRLVVVAT